LPPSGGREADPALATLRHSLAFAQEWQGIVKVGRTHMMDAVPVTLGQEFGAWARQVELGIARLRDAMPRLLLLAQGGTAVGTGLNCHPAFDRVFCERLAALTGLAFAPNPNKFEGMGAHDALVELSGVLNVIAVSFTRIGNDIRLLGSGPRTGLAELIVPADPGQLDHARQDQSDPVRGADHGRGAGPGNHVTVTIAGAGAPELNVLRPVSPDRAAGF
jgi:fumarate hydratase class II